MLNLETIVFDLPEDVLKRKWSGDFEGEIALIDALVAREDIPDFLKQRLMVERRNAEMLPRQYRYSRPVALEMLRERIPDFQESELDALELNRAVEYIYIKGEKYYLRSFLSNLLKTNASLAERAGVALSNRSSLDDAIAEMKEKGSLSYKIRIHGDLSIEDEHFVKGAKVRVHMPLPQFCAQQSEIQVHSGADHIDTETAIQRTAYFERTMDENVPFTVDYSYRNTVYYVDPLSEEKPSAHVYPNAPAVTDDDLSEQLPHIVFTPYLRQLAELLKGDETDPARIAWRFYDYITTKINYSYMRSYCMIDRHAEYCALNGKGDCGIQAILFITLCRICGIPARWQSGLAVDPDRPGSHDWAQFYIEPYGWLFCDPSYGGSAFRKGAEERRKFYFGNLDPFRMVANSRYQTDFNPPKFCDRWDPYDSQDGEVELNGVGLRGYQFDTDYKTVEFEKL